MSTTSNEVEVLVQGPKVTVGFKRNLRVRDYESAEASIFIEVPTKPGDNIDTITEQVQPAFAAAKATVFTQLGITFDIDPTDLVVREMLEKQLGAVEVGPEVAQQAAVAVTQAPRSQSYSGGGGSPAPTSKDGLWAELAAEPRKWFDNRADKANGKVKPGNPDFKRKYTGEKLWVDYQGKSNIPEGITVPDASAF